ncbi:PLP-dependent aminotransferase family protein [Erwiniaceae bacterium L1_54_6]|nr:PLP-dependent aminotransferase family protein [Erwiniaceae bacterium L1_54_6]
MPKNDKNSGPLALTLDRADTRGLSEQLRQVISSAIADGQLTAGTRLPSCRDLAAQLGVARGTVRRAYDMLVDSQLLVAKGAAGTFVAAAALTQPPRAPITAAGSPLLDMIYDFDTPPLTFQMGVPASDAFPAKVWTRVLQRQARQQASQSRGYPDPRGSLALRQALVGYLAVARGIQCQASQILITNGYAGALGLIALALGLHGQQAWMEEPGFMLARAALQQMHVTPVGIPVDDEGLQVAEGMARAPDAAFALVTAGQQAPLGVTLSLPRRQALLAWASSQQRWIIEDDYLGELQLGSRAAPALAAIDSEGRVIHVGTFSKTLSPSLRLGFVVVPPALAVRFADTSALLAPASSALLHDAVAEFLREGHFLRHLRRMKRVYHERLEGIVAALRPHFPDVQRAGLAVIIRLTAGTPDQQIAREALAYGLAPAPLSIWYQHESGRQYGFLLGVTQLPREGFARCAERLKWLVDAHQRRMDQ